jgi:hypothetical protein
MKQSVFSLNFAVLFLGWLPPHGWERVQFFHRANILAAVREQNFTQKIVFAANSRGLGMICRVFIDFAPGHKPRRPDSRAALIIDVNRDLCRKSSTNHECLAPLTE